MYPENGNYDPELQTSALKLIIEFCPRQSAAAAEALRVPGLAARQMRLDRLIPEALREAASVFDDTERGVLARAITATSGETP